MGNGRPLVSIVMLCQHRESFRMALHSVKSQTYDNLEIMVVQDGCPSNSKLCCKRTCESVSTFIKEEMKNDSRISYIKDPQCSGYGSAYLRNLAIANTKGTYIAYLDDDNTWEPDHVKSLFDKFDSFINFAWSGSFLWKDGKKVGKRLLTIPIRNGIDTSEIMHRRYLVERLGGWKDRRNIPLARLDQDWELIRRFIRAGYKGVCSGRVTCNYTLGEHGWRYRVKDMIFRLFGRELSPGIKRYA